MKENPDCYHAEFSDFVASSVTGDAFFGGLRIFSNETESLQGIREMLSLLQKRMQDSSSDMRQINAILIEASVRHVKRLTFPKHPRDGVNYKGLSLLINVMEKSSIEFIDIAIQATERLFHINQENTPFPIANSKQKEIFDTLMEIKREKTVSLARELQQRLDAIKITGKKRRITKEKKNFGLKKVREAIQNCQVEGVRPGLDYLVRLHALTHTKENGPEFFDKRRMSQTPETKTRHAIKEEFGKRLLNYFTNNDLVNYTYTHGRAERFFQLMKVPRYQFFITRYMGLLKSDPELSTLRAHASWGILQSKENMPMAVPLQQYPGAHRQSPMVINFGK